MTGFLGLELISQTGAKFQRMPIDLASFAMAVAIAAVQLFCVLVELL